MEYVIVGLFFAAILHFVYESVLAPSLRTQLRFDLLSIRDRLHSLKLALRSEFDDHHFEHMEAIVNTFVSLLDRFDASDLIGFEAEAPSNCELREQCDQFTTATKECLLPEVRELQHRIARIAARAIWITSKGDEQKADLWFRLPKPMFGNRYGLRLSWAGAASVRTA